MRRHWSASTYSRSALLRRRLHAGVEGRVDAEPAPEEQTETLLAGAAEDRVVADDVDDVVAGRTAPRTFLQPLRAIAGLVTSGVAAALAAPAGVM